MVLPPKPQKTLNKSRWISGKMSYSSRKRIFQELRIQRDKNSASNFPTLFDLSVQACISNLQIYATFEGLSFYPFGQALFSEFTKRSNQWRITTEQRQAGIILFSESFGEFISPEYTGIKCSLPQDITYLSSFSECLVYLDLSGGSFGSSSGQDGATQFGFSDKDITGLSALSQLRILNLSQLNIGDTGLSHLVRSVTFGSFGPAQLEYLNLSGTRITDTGLEKIFSGKDQNLLVFKNLLGIDLTNSDVDGKKAERLFKIHMGTWKRLENKITLFPESPTSKASRYEREMLYLESTSGINPMQKWLDCFSSRSLKIGYGQKPDLSSDGSGSWGLSESLAISKLGQIYYYPVSDNQPNYWNDRNESAANSPSTIGKKIRSKRSRYLKDIEDSLPRAGTIQQQQSDLEHMYNLKMYQRVLNSISETTGSLTLSKSQKNTAKGERLAFVRGREHVEKTIIDFSDLDLISNLVPQNTLETKRSSTSNKSTTNLAKVRDRHNRNPVSVASKIVPISYPELMDHKVHDTISRPISRKPSRTIFLKHMKERDPFPFIKNEPNISLSNVTPDNNHANVKQHVFSANTKYCPPPFVKPLSEQISSKTFVTKQEQFLIPQLREIPTKASSQPSTKKKPAQTSAGLMESWVKKQSPKQSPAVPSANKTPALQFKTTTTGNVSSSNHGNIVREFYFSDEANKTVNLERWIQSGSAPGSGHEAEIRPRKIIRYDPKNKLFKDNDTNLDLQSNGQN